MQQAVGKVAAMEDVVKSVHKAAEKRVDEAQAAAQKTVFAKHRHTATVIYTKEAAYRKRIDSLISAHKEVVKGKDDKISRSKEVDNKLHESNSAANAE
eukprot:5319293-Ditylum_brightwellii.AAC.1